jgi:hypothetical protein
VALGPQRISEIFGFANLDADRYGAVRRGRLWFYDQLGKERPSWAARAAQGHAREPRFFWIDTRIDWTRYARISWQQVPTALDRSPELFRGRIVLMGEDTQDSDDDYYPVPSLVLQALMVDTIRSGLPIQELGRTPVLMAAVLGSALAMAGILCARRARPVVAWAAAGAILYLALSFPAFWWAGLILPVTVPLLLLAVGLLAALLLRRNLPSPPEVSTA